MNDLTQPTWKELDQAAKTKALRHLIEERHLPYSKAAKILGTTRSALVGHASRHKILNPGLAHLKPSERANSVIARRAKLAPKKVKAPSEPKSRPPTKKPHKFVVADISEAIIDRRPPNPTAWNALPGTSPVPLALLREHTCKWPIGADDQSFLFCGEHTKEHSPYCPAHDAMAYKPALVLKLKGKKQ